MPEDSLPATENLRNALITRGFAFLRAPGMRSLLQLAGPLDDWEAFSESWNDLELDRYMADGGRYRRRRHAVFTVETGQAPQREPHQPHYQSLDYNPVNGGIARWFEPIRETVAESRSLGTVLRFCQQFFGQLAPSIRRWRVELHQFRIEAREGEGGQPTPEGMHRDGVDYVLVLLIRRSNIASGTTGILNLNGDELGSFTLTEPFDAALVDDARVFHGVTAVQALDAALPAYRDVLVVTFRRN